MKIGLVCPYSLSWPGGVQNAVLGLAGWLKASGNQVSVLAPGRLSGQGLDSQGLTSQDVISAGEGVAVRYNGSVARINFGPRVARQVRDWLSVGAFDVVNLHEPIMPALSFLALRAARVPVVATFHAATPRSIPLHVAGRLLASTVSRIDHATAVSEVAADVARSHLGLEAQVIGNGIHLASYQCRQSVGRGRAGNHPVLLFVGRYDEPRKGFDLLLAALPHVRRLHPDLEVVVVGRGRPRMIPGVRFLGGLDDAGRNEWLGRADLYVAPQTGRESFGIVLLEALACGAPVLAADLPAFRAVLTDDQGLVGRLFRTCDANSLTAGIVAALAAPDPGQVARGRARAAQFDWSVIGPQMLAAYRLVIDRRRA